MITENPNQPTAYDAVLGGQAPAPMGSLVLGGIEGVKGRFASPVVEARVAAIQEASKYGNPGLELIVKALTDESEIVQKTAYLLLQKRKEIPLRQILKEFIPYHLFDCSRTLKAGCDITISSDGTTLAYLQGKTIRVYQHQTNELLYKIPKYPKAREFYALGLGVETLIRIVNTTRHFIEVWYLDELQHTLRGHEAEIRAIAMSPDGKTFATGSQDQSIKIWNLESGKLICTFGNHLTWGSHQGEIWDLKFSADGSTLVSSSSDGTIKLWNLQNRDRPRTFKVYSNYLAMSPNGQIIAIRNWDRSIKLLDVATGKVINAWNLVSAISFIFSPDGKVIVSGSADKTIRFLDVQTGKTIQILTGHQDVVNCLAFSQDGHTLISGSLDKTVKIWEVV